MDKRVGERTPREERKRGLAIMVIIASPLLFTETIEAIDIYRNYIGYQSTLISSTSNTRVAKGGIMAPAPPSP